MATSLAAQLAQRQTALSSTLLAAPSATPSFVYSARHAAQISTVHLADLAQSAFDQLAATDPALERYSALLFSPAARDTDRTTLPLADNAKLDAALHAVLRALAKHLLLKPAGLVLEWLVRRFRVHEFNVPALVALFLPYHATPHFVALVALIPPPVLATQFPLFVPLQKALQPLPLHTLVTLLPPHSPHTAARPLLEFVLNLPSAYLASSDPVPVPRVVSSFWLQAIATYLDSTPALAAGERALVLSTLLATVRSAGAKAHEADTLVASFVLLSRFALKNPLQTNEVNTVLKVVVAALPYSEDENVDEAWLTTLVVVAGLGDAELESPKEGKLWLGKEGWKTLLRLPNLQQHLVALSGEYDTTRFMTRFLTSLVLDSLDSSSSLDLLQSLALTPALPASTRTLLTTSVLSHLSPPNKDITPLLKVLKGIYQRYPSLWDAALSTRSPTEQHTALELVVGKELMSLMVGNTVSPSYLESVLGDDEVDSDALLRLVRRGDPLLLDVLLSEKYAARLGTTSEVMEALKGVEDLDAVARWYRRLEGEKEARDRYFWKRLLSSKGRSGIEPLATAAWATGLKKSQDEKANEGVVKMLAKNLSSAETADKEFLTRLVGDQDTLALLVYAEMDNKAAVMEGQAMLSSLGIKSLDQVASGTKDKVAKHVYENPHGTETRKLVLGRVVESLVDDNAQGTEEAIYRLSHTGTSTSAKLFGGKLLSGLFMSLGGGGSGAEVLAFLERVWVKDADAGLRSIAIKEAGIWIEAVGEKRDWQGLAIGLVVALSDQDRTVRIAAVELVKTLRKWCGDTPSLVTSAEDRLAAADFIAYLDKVLASATEIVMDPAHLSVLHATLLESVEEPSKKKKHSLKFKIGSYLLASLLALPDGRAVRQSILASLEGITDGWKKALIVLVLEKVLKGDEEVDEADAKALLSPYRTASRKWLDGTEHALQAFWEALDTPGPMQREGLRIVQTSFFALVRGETRLELFKRLVRLGDTGDVNVLTCLRSIEVDSETFTTILNEIKVSLSSPVSKGAKRNRTSLGATQSRSSRLPELVTILENVVVEAMVPTAEGALGQFDLLSNLIEMGASTQTDIQYPGQLVLGTLSKTFDNVQPSSGISTRSIRMGSILDFMRASANPQTSQQALLLLAKLGPLVPDQLVHNIMPIFTLMGANVLQRDDAYSLRVVEQTIESIVPALVTAMKKKASGREALVSDLKDLIQVFTDAAGHVPRHRRVQLFVRFVEMLGPREFLAAVAMLLLDSDSNADTLLLPLSVLEGFSIDFQLLAIKQIIDEIAILIQQGVEGASIPFLSVPEDDAEAQAQILNLVHFITVALETRQLGAKVDASRATAADTIDPSLSELVRSFLDVSALPASTPELVEATGAAVQATVRLMSAKSLSEAILWLLDTSDTAVQTSALSLLRSRLPTVKQARRGDLSPAVVAVVDRIRLAIAGALPVDTETLATLDAIISSAWAGEDLVLSRTLPELLRFALLPTTSKSALLASLEMVRKLTTRLGPRLIPMIAKIVPFSVNLISAEAKSTTSTSAVVSSAFAILEGLFSSIPTFIGAQVDTVFAAMLAPDVVTLLDGRDVGSAKARAALLSTAAKKLPAKTLYPAIIRLHASVDPADKMATLGLLDLLNRALRNGKTTDIAENYRPIFKLFLSVFDLRRQQPVSLSLDDVNEIEDNALGAFIQFILKLNEQTFRPLFLRTYDWAVIDLVDEPDAQEALIARRTVLYKLMDRLLGQLKSIVVPYFSFMLDLTIELFESFARGDLHDLALWTAVTVALTKALEYDESGFWTPVRLGKLSVPVATQLQSPEPLSTSTITTYLHPLIKVYSHALLPHEKILKVFNTSLLMMTRSDDLRVKRSALEAMEQVWESLGDGMLGLVPETTPFLAETLEEVEGGVEATTRRLITRIEAHLGESLDSYLD